MTVDKMSVSLALPLSNAVRIAAEEAGETLSGWLADAAQTKLRARAFDVFLEAWESENGALTEEELRNAAERLGPVASTTSEWSDLFVLSAPEGNHGELVATVARIIEGGRPVLIRGQDVPDVFEMTIAEGIALERTEIRVKLPAR